MDNLNPPRDLTFAESAKLGRWLVEYAQFDMLEAGQLQDEAMQYASRRNGLSIKEAEQQFMSEETNHIHRDVMWYYYCVQQEHLRGA